MQPQVNPHAIDITLWHSMTGAFGIGERAFGDHIASAAEEFNKSQSEYKVHTAYKGRYEKAMSAGLAAFHAGHAPHLLQVFEMGTATMIAAREVIKPAADVMKEAGERWDPHSYVPLVAGYYTAPNGQLLSFPFNISTPILYYNREAFAKAGLDPDKAPATWPEVATAAARLKASGMRYGHTTTRQTWVHLESFSTWHDVEFATRNNGFDGLDARLCFNSPLHVRHIQNLADQARHGLFTHAGRMLESEPLFCEGGCGMITTASAAYASIVRRADFEVGVAPLPYYADVPGAPRNTTIGGSSLWVMNGKTKEEYTGVARFLSSLSRPEVQARRHQEIGYLPVSTAAYALTGNPAMTVSVRQLLANEPTSRSRGIRINDFMRIRHVLDEALEDVWSGKQDAKTALDRAVQRGNELLEGFASESR